MPHGPRLGGLPLAVTELGDGPPVLLLHGLFSSAEVNWLKYGAAQRLAEAGYRVILPDLRGHGRSGVPDGPDGWPADVLALDAEAVIDALALGPELVVGGYSLGARTTARLLQRGRVGVRGAILAGMGLEGLVAGKDRFAFFQRVIMGRDRFRPGAPEYAAAAFLKANVARPDGLLPLFAALRPLRLEDLRVIDQPVVLVCGTQDQDNGSAPALRQALPQAELLEVPGTHMSAVTTPAFGHALVRAMALLNQARPVLSQRTASGQAAFDAASE